MHYYIFKKKPTIIICHFAGIGSNPNQPSGYSVRMDNTLPLVTQAPAIQTLPLRPGVIAQVRACMPKLQRFQWIQSKTQSHQSSVGLRTLSQRLHRFRTRKWTFCSVVFVLHTQKCLLLIYWFISQCFWFLIRMSFFVFFFFFFLQQPWSNRTPQILVPTWQQVPPPPTTLPSDTVSCPQRRGDWG